jgi:hypothetical protein
MKNGKRILSVTIKRMMDESPDTSYLGEYSNRPKSEYAIDRAHSEDCASVSPEAQRAKETLEHAQQTAGDIHNAVLAQYNGTLANEKLDTEREALDDAYNLLGELADEVVECDCGERGDMERNEYRYFNGNVENYKGESPENIRKYVRQNYARMESLSRGDWCYMGIRGEAQIAVPTAPKNSIIQTITSGGLWGIESDSDKDYLASVEQEELSDLRGQLKALGFSSRAISTALKNVERKDA